MKEFKNQIIEKAKKFGACAVGIADVEALKQSPSHLIYPLKLNALPGRNGVYSRPLCKDQMELDRENANNAENENHDQSARLVKCCRLCETSCPIGKK